VCTCPIERLAACLQPRAPTVTDPCRIWAYWISPFAYLLRAIVINEMTSPHWDIPYSPGRTLGQVRNNDRVGTLVRCAFPLTMFQWFRVAVS